MNSFEFQVSSFEFPANLLHLKLETRNVKLLPLTSPP